MADVSLPPSQPIPGPSPATQGSGSQTGGGAVGSLPTGTVLQGYIINRDATGNPILRTDKGDVPFATNVFLKIGSEVVLRITNTGGAQQANLVSVDGQPPEAATATPTNAQEPEVILSPTLTATATPGAAAAPSITVNGTVVSQPTATTPQAPVATNGTQLTLKVVSLTAPSPAVPSATTTSSATPPQAASASYATYARAAGVPAAVTTTSPAPAATQATVSPQTPAATIAQASVANASSTPVATAAATTLPNATTTQTLSTNTIAIPNAPGAEQAAPTINAASATVSPVTVPTATTEQPLTQPAVTTAAPTTATVQTQSTVLSEPPVATAVAPQPSPASNATPPTIQPGNTIAATVISSEPSGEALIQSSIGFVRLQAGTPLPAGSQVTLEVVQATPPSSQDITSAFSNAQPAPITELAQQWNSVQQIFSLLAGRTAAPAAGLQDPAASSSPIAFPSIAHVADSSANAQAISGGLLLFLSALRKGDFNDWLGDNNIRQLQSQGHDDLIKKAQGEFTSMARQFAQTQPGHWQPLFFPLAVESAVQQVRLFIKRDRKQGSAGDSKKQEDTRFVIEVDLSQLGELQMDGFVRTQEKDLQFDMVIRSLSGLSDEVQQDIAAIYNNMGAITGYKGSITFQNVREFPVNPMQDIADTHGPVMV